eukprot:GHVR01110873.1.p1 GENE.GHVR01110873.1~~GHVR01110873.1.p1  ORF type:complete len:100 (-),score=53.64 GHVR01110873.1:29-328(-)
MCVCDTRCMCVCDSSCMCVCRETTESVCDTSSVKVAMAVSVFDHCDKLQKTHAVYQKHPVVSRHTCGNIPYTDKHIHRNTGDTHTCDTHTHVTHTHTHT